MTPEERDAELVEADKRGYHVHYRLDGRAVAEVRRLLCQLLDTEERTDQ